MDEPLTMLESLPGGEVGNLPGLLEVEPKNPSPRNESLGDRPLRVCINACVNVSWRRQRRVSCIEFLGAHIMALQETMLSSLPLERARASLCRLGYALHQGGVCTWWCRSSCWAWYSDFCFTSAGRCLAAPSCNDTPPRAYTYLHDRVCLLECTFSEYVPFSHDIARGIFNETFLEFATS